MFDHNCICFILDVYLIFCSAHFLEWWICFLVLLLHFRSRTHARWCHTQNVSRGNDDIMSVAFWQFVAKGRFMFCVSLWSFLCDTSYIFLVVTHINVMVLKHLTKTFAVICLTRNSSKKLALFFCECQPLNDVVYLSLTLST